MEKFKNRSISILFLLSMFVLSILVIDYVSFEATAGSNKTGTSTSVPSADKIEKPRPAVLIRATCQVAQADIPGEFVGTGFMPNVTVTVKVDRNNNTEAAPSEPVTLLLSKTTDSAGNVSGEFTLNTQLRDRSDYRNYFVHVYSTQNNQEATASLNVC